jgi:Mg2+ and Co2+ transporter CorA
MDKKEINSPKLTEHFLFWVIGIAGVIMALLFAHYVYHVI